MTANQDFKDLFAAFNDAGVDYLVVGAHALAVHGHVRASKDLDIWIRPERGNAARVLQALTAFGCPLFGLTVEDLTDEETVFQIGVQPVRIDILCGIDGVSFDVAWRERVTSRFAGQPVSVLSRDHLIQNKRASGRPQDLADIAALDALDVDD